MNHSVATQPGRWIVSHVLEDSAAGELAPTNSERPVAEFVTEAEARGFMSKTASGPASHRLHFEPVGAIR